MIKKDNNIWLNLLKAKINYKYFVQKWKIIIDIWLKGGNYSIST